MACTCIRRLQALAAASSIVHPAHPRSPWCFWLQNRSDHYNITRLDPAYRLVFRSNVTSIAASAPDPGTGAAVCARPAGQAPTATTYGGGPATIDVPGTLDGFLSMAASLDAAADVRAFMADAEVKYRVGMDEAIWSVPSWPLPSWMFNSSMKPSLITTSLRDHIASYASNERLRLILEWPSQFIGVDAARAPSLYSLMSYGGHALGTWLPDPQKGGMQAPALALFNTAVKMGVEFHFNEAVTSITAGADGYSVSSVHTAAGREWQVDGIVAAADYYFVEQHLLPPSLRRHSPSWWEKQVMTPRSLVFMLCIEGSAIDFPSLSVTHSLWFDDADVPFYANSDVDARRFNQQQQHAPSGATDNKTSLFILVPSLSDTAPMPPRDRILSQILERIGIPPSLVSCGAGGYGPEEFSDDYNAFRGNAFGHANILSQSMWLKPAMDSLASNLVFAGHLTHPGPGVPPALVSGIVAANHLHDQLRPVSIESQIHWLITFAVLLFSIAFVNSTAVQNARALHRGGRTYFAAASAMPLSEFNRIAALYAVFRKADDLVDCTHLPPATRERNLDAFEAQILASEKSRLGYPPKLWNRFFSAMRTDTDPAGLVCRTRSELERYMDGSAAVLGEFMLPIVIGDRPVPLNAPKQSAGETSSSTDVPSTAVSEQQQLVKPARALGLAFQLTNMIRDIIEDTRLHRQYIPVDVCLRYGIKDLAQAAENAGSMEFRGLVEEMFTWADHWYAEADRGIAELPVRTRAPIALARKSYHRLHDAIRSSGYRLEPRVKVSWTRKLADATEVLTPLQVLRIPAAELFLVLCGWVSDWGSTAAVVLGSWIATQVVQLPGQAVSYGQFHQAWTVPAVIALASLVYYRWNRCRLAASTVVGASSTVADIVAACKWAAVLVVVAAFYTTPWDSYLIACQVWASSEANVSGTFLYIPYEEYLFFILATLITCLTWMTTWPSQWVDVEATGAAAVAGAGGIAGVAQPQSKPSKLVTVFVVAAFLLGIVAVLTWDRFLYLGLLLAWSMPVLLLQWVVGGHILHAHRYQITKVVLMSSIPMAVVDAWAIQRNVWVINPEYTLWPWTRGLHPEEVLFFALTSTMCAWGLTLAVWESKGHSPHLAGGKLQPWIGPAPAEPHSTSTGSCDEGNAGSQHKGSNYDTTKQPGVAAAAGTSANWQQDTQLQQ